MENRIVIDVIRAIITRRSAPKMTVYMLDVKYILTEKEFKELQGRMEDDVEILDQYLFVDDVNTRLKLRVIEYFGLLNRQKLVYDGGEFMIVNEVCRVEINYLDVIDHIVYRTVRKIRRQCIIDGVRVLLDNVTEDTMLGKKYIIKFIADDDVPMSTVEVVMEDWIGCIESLSENQP